MMEAGIRTPKEVIAIAAPDKADDIERLLVKALESASDNETHGAVIMVAHGELIWGTHYYK